jgi:hypothetical protein
VILDGDVFGQAERLFGRGFDQDILAIEAQTLIGDFSGGDLNRSQRLDGVYEDLKGEQ